MQASVNLYRRIAERACQPMQAIKGCLMQLQNRPGAQLKGPFYVFHMSADDIYCEAKLPKPIFRLSTSDLLGVGEKCSVLRFAVAIRGHVNRRNSLFSCQPQQPSHE